MVSSGCASLNARYWDSNIPITSDMNKLLWPIQKGPQGVHALLSLMPLAGPSPPQRWQSKHCPVSQGITVFFAFCISCIFTWFTFTLLDAKQFEDKIYTFVIIFFTVLSKMSSACNIHLNINFWMNKEKKWVCLENPKKIKRKKNREELPKGMFFHWLKTIPLAKVIKVYDIYL